MQGPISRVGTSKLWQTDAMLWGAWPRPYSIPYGVQCLLTILIHCESII